MSIDYDLTPIAEAEFVFGLSDHGHHIVAGGDMAAATKRIEGDPWLAPVPALCGQLVALTPVWGPYSRETARRHPGRCPDCAWILALHRGAVDEEIAAFTAARDNLDAAAIAASVGDIAQKVLTAVVRDPDLADCGQRLAPSHQSQILGHVSRHLPVVGVCEECVEIGTVNAHGHGVPCPAQKVTCARCSVASHEEWAGEWAGTFLQECTVTAPCSVLITVATHYRIPIG
ncbi:hypothetical protein [Mycolicibacterium fortuitum]|uniref:Uncharacterized protein n=2 Tax=Mycolicibacterium fortuitum TaxID=1766 RepID=A0AAE5AEH1_MYCFO|nr:hypothetical protein [Mycolicibacterium fortuitum]MCV7138397.1 hypothetical protein [Mycolicibacterium fortuitum]MDV7193693.1 hypothetical protein [Mycolicibacterium fortuitum]MDV7207102.1 hypothetical protein [Mycolicibacterium fortuitum]MDV7228613.1 hypothetical protein [Mycolicibacterium fortuitum]MDV7260623.1 hypothetical protein [Mycolicibacterium fortuitum]